jgi:hypothetical protein
MVLAGRDARKGADAVSRIQGAIPAAILACLVFAFELQRRSEARRWGVTSIAAHPGFSRTDLLHNGPDRWSVHGRGRSLLPFLFQPGAEGVLPTM